MIELDYSDKNEVTFLIQRANNQTAKLFYRDPTTEERVSYSAEMIKKINGKIIDHSVQNRLKYGKIILTGFPDDQFSYKGKEISCNPESKNYDPDWKNFLEKTFSDLIIKLAYMVFEGTLVGSEMPVINLEGDDQLPLESSSS